MNDWIIISTFTYPHEAHFAKAKLESEGIEVMLKDELTTQVNNFYSGAIGGVKLEVRNEDVKDAIKLLIEMGIIKASTNDSFFLNNLQNKLLIFSNTIPIINKFPVEIRVFSILLFIVLIITALVIIITFPYQS